ncbi:MAG: GDP-mannose 4,6-dehydratase [Patescibacteria group bacterium]
MNNNSYDSFSNYRDKKVLVTGADGFMGSHLTERLIDLGAKVTAFVRGTSVTGTHQYELKNISHLTSKIDILAANIASKDTIQLIKEIQPDIILHLAAEAYVPKSFSQPLEVFSVNLDGTLNVLEAARQLPNLERVVITSSSEVYGTYSEPITELHLLNPTSPYAASKVAADRAAYSWYVTYKLPVAIIRPFNTYGPRHTYDVIPKFIDLALKNKPLTIYGNGQQSRDFTYVSDTVDGFLLMGIHPDAVGQVVNFGAGTAITVETIAREVIKITGSSSEVTYIKDRLAEVGSLTCSWDKANKLFNWTPKVDLSQGLELNIQWAKSRL